MKASRLFLLGTLILMLFMTVPAMAFIDFTGNVEADFLSLPDILIIDDGSNEVMVEDPYDPNIEYNSGWDIKDLRLAYDATSDTMYVGVNSHGIVGDVDGNGCPDTSSFPDKYLDLPELSGGESVAVYFDLDMEPYPFNNDNSWDVIAGVGNGVDNAGFTVSEWDHTISFYPPYNFGAPLSGHTGSTPISPSLFWPDYEFTIENFSGLASSVGLVDAKLDEFRVGAFMGSPDDGVGEDSVYYHQYSRTEVTITSSEPAVIEGGTVDLTVTEQNYSTASLSFINVKVEVTKNGVPFITLMDPPDGGDDGNLMLDPGETWSWTIPSDAITEATTFVATGFGFGPPGFLHTYPEDPNEQDEVTVEILGSVGSIVVEITSNPETVIGSQTVDLIVAVSNDGDVNLTNVQIVVTQNGEELPFSPLVAPPDSGDVSDPCVFNVGETWVWDRTSDLITVDPTVFVATGSAEYDDIIVTYPQEPNAQDSVTVPMMDGATRIDIKANGSDGLITIGAGDPVTLTICELNNSIGEISLTNVQVDVYYDNVDDGIGDEIYLTTLMTPPDIGDDGDNVLENGENWCWDYVVPEVNEPIIFIAYGYGEYIVGELTTIVTWCEIPPPAPPPALPGLIVICDPNERDEVPVEIEYIGGEGCTPGFWKNNGQEHGASAWCERFSPSDPISMHFSLNETLVIRGNGKRTIKDPTLLQALNANGGGVNAMIRHGIAAMLNAGSDCVQYEYSSEDQVIFMIEDTLNGIGDYTVDELHYMFAEANEAGCPVNQHGECVGIEVEVEEEINE